MKKLIALLLAAMMTLSVFTACGSKNEPEKKPEESTGTTETKPEDAIVETPEEQPEEQPEETPEEQPEEQPEETPEEAPAGSDSASSELTALLNDIYAIAKPEFMTAEIPFELTDADALFYYTGLTDSSLLTEAIVSESAMGSQAYSLVLARAADASKVAEIVEGMKNGIDTRKWICVEADDLRVVASGDIIMLIMVESAFAPTITADVMVDAFQQASGLTLDIE